MKCSTLTVPLVLATILISGSSARATVRRVIEFPSGCIIAGEGTCCRTTCDGSDWTSAKAYKSIKDAIADSSNGDQIWVKTGTYYPDECYDTSCSNDDRTSTFRISNPAVNMYGGFAGSETATSQRVLRCNGGVNINFPCEVNGDCPGSTCSASPTVLSGDLAKDDGSGPCDEDSDCGSAETCSGGVCSAGGGPCSTAADCIECQAGTCSAYRDDNAYHVVTYNDASASTVFDGFVVIKGQANSNCSARNQGSAFHIRDTDSICRGGPDDTDPCTCNSDCETASCSANVCTDGAREGDACSTSADCPVACAPDLCLTGGPDIVDSIFRNNYSIDHSALNDHALATEIDNCVFKDNLAKEGGAIVVEHGSPHISYTLFERNIVVGPGCQTTDDGTGQGGAIWLNRELEDETCTGVSEPVISNCHFHNNSAEQGGAIWTRDSSVTIEGCTFTGNAAIGQPCDCSSTETVEGRGGAIWGIRTEENEDDVEIEIRSCTFGDSSIAAPDFCDPDHWTSLATGPRNVSVNKGGGLFLEGEDIAKKLTATIEDNEFYGQRTTMRENTACLQVTGGGAFWAKFVDLEMHRNTFKLNDTNHPGGYGGAVHILDSLVKADRNSFIQNHAYISTGAAWEEITPGFEDDLDRSIWSNNVFSGNSTGHSCGEPVGSTYEARDSAFYSANTDMKNCSFSANDVAGESTTHYAVNVPNGRLFEATNTIFWNTLDGSTAREIRTNNSGEVVLTNCVLRGGSASIHDGNSGSGAPPSLTLCLTSNPEFDAGSGHDLRLASNSPCIDAGNTDAITGIALDNDGNTRVLDTLGVASGYGSSDDMCIVDIGAQEYQPDAADCCFLEDCGAGNACCEGECITDWSCCSNVDCDGAACCDGNCRMGWTCCDNSDCKAGKICCETTQSCVSPIICGY